MQPVEKTSCGIHSHVVIVLFKTLCALGRRFGVSKVHFQSVGKGDEISQEQVIFEPVISLGAATTLAEALFHMIAAIDGVASSGHWRIELDLVKEDIRVIPESTNAFKLFSNTLDFFAKGYEGED